VASNIFQALPPGADAPIPPSLRQAVRLLNTPEVTAVAARVTSGVATGMTQAATRYIEGEPVDPNDPEAVAAAAAATALPREIVNNVLDRVLDTRNWGLVSLIVSITTRQTLEAGP